MDLLSGIRRRTSAQLRERLLKLRADLAEVVAKIPEVELEVEGAVVDGRSSTWNLSTLNGLKFKHGAIEKAIAKIENEELPAAVAYERERERRRRVAEERRKREARVEHAERFDRALAQAELSWRALRALDGRLRKPDASLIGQALYASAPTLFEALGISRAYAHKGGSPLRKQELAAMPAEEPLLEEDGASTLGSGVKVADPLEL